MDAQINVRQTDGAGAILVRIRNLGKRIRQMLRGNAHLFPIMLPKIMELPGEAQGEPTSAVHPLFAGLKQGKQES